VNIRRAIGYSAHRVRFGETESLAAGIVQERRASWEAEDALLRLKTELNHMPAELRDVLVLHRLQRQSYSDIASTLGVSTRTVERRMSRAMDYLARRMRGVL
jgi:RNA polymerase sigma factor (sigma-70 family)